MATQRSAGGGLGIGIILLAAELFGVGIPNIPPVTLGFIALNSAIYLRLLRIVRSVSNACVSYHLAWKLGQWKRVLLASFYHLDSMHLYFNMVSFLWKGRTLERRFGSRKFFIIIMVFALLSQMLMLFMNRVLSILFWDSSYITTCAAGFSAVIFGLKVLTTQNMWQESVSILGLPVTVPAQFACWIELVLIKILVPNSSLVGHLAGILIGMAFVQGPVKGLVDTIDGFIGSRLGEVGPVAPRAHTAPNRGSYTYASGTTGYRAQGNNRVGDALDGSEEHQIQEAIRRSLLDQNMRNSGYENPSVRSRHQQPYPSYGWNVPHQEGFAPQQGPYPPDQGPYPPDQRPYPQDQGPYPSDYQTEDPSLQDRGRSNSAPYPVDDSYRMPYPDNYRNSNGGIYPDLDRADSMMSTDSVPSAPPLERGELYSVD